MCNTSFDVPVTGFEGWRSASGWELCLLPNGELLAFHSGSGATNLLDQRAAWVVAQVAGHELVSLKNTVAVTNSEMQPPAPAEVAAMCSHLEALGLLCRDRCATV